MHTSPAVKATDICRKLKPSVRRRHLQAENPLPTQNTARSADAKTTDEKLQLQPQPAVSDMSRASTMPSLMPRLVPNQHQHQQQLPNRQRSSGQSFEKSEDVLEALLSADTGASRASGDCNQTECFTAISHPRVPSSASSGQGNYHASSRPPRRPSASRLSRESRGSEDYTTLTAFPLGATAFLSDSEAGPLPKTSFELPFLYSPYAWQGGAGDARLSWDDANSLGTRQALCARSDFEVPDSIPSGSLLAGMPYTTLARLSQAESARGPVGGLISFRPSRLSTVSSDNESAAPTPGSVAGSVAGSDTTLEQAIAASRMLASSFSGEPAFSNSEPCSCIAAFGSDQPPTPTDEERSDLKTADLADAAATLNSHTGPATSSRSCFQGASSLDAADSNEPTTSDLIWSRGILLPAKAPPGTADATLSPVHSPCSERSRAHRRSRSRTEPVSRSECWLPTSAPLLPATGRLSTMSCHPSFTRSPNQPNELSPKECLEAVVGDQVQLLDTQRTVSPYQNETGSKANDMRSPFAVHMPGRDASPVAEEPHTIAGLNLTGPAASAQTPSQHATLPPAMSDSETLDSRIKLARAFSAAGPRSITSRGLHRELGQTFPPPIAAQYPTPFVQALTFPDSGPSVAMQALPHSSSNHSQSSRMSQSFDQPSSMMTENSERLPESYCTSTSGTPSNAGVSSFSELVQEIAVMKKLAHPNIVKLHEVRFL